MMAVLLSLVIVNFGGFRIDRNMSIAQNELITNLKKAQSYTLSSRLVANNQPGQFFILQFDGQNPTQYKLQALYNITATPTPPSLVDVETFKLPIGVRLATPAPVKIYRTVTPLVQPDPSVSAVTCSLIAFKAPFARTFFNGYVTDVYLPDTGCSYRNLNNDDYQKLLNYVVNVDGNRTSTDSYAVIQLTDTTGTKIKKVLVRGVTGVICPTQDGVTCSSN